MEMAKASDGLDKAQLRKKIQRLRRDAGYKSAAAFAEHIGMPVSTYTSYEQGKSALSFETALMIADTLNCSLDELGCREWATEKDESGHPAVPEPGSRKKQAGKNLQKLRMAADFKSAKAFAEHVGINPNTYTQYEQGLVGLGLEQAWLIADALGCTLDELAGRTPPQHGSILADELQRLMDHAYETMNDAGKAQAAHLVFALSTAPMYSGDRKVGGHGSTDDDTGDATREPDGGW